jgi:hypothetical protein
VIRAFVQMSKHLGCIGISNNGVFNFEVSRRWHDSATHTLRVKRSLPRYIPVNGRKRLQAVAADCIATSPRISRVLDLPQLSFRSGPLFWAANAFGPFLVG